MSEPKPTAPTQPLTFLITGCSSGFGLSLSRLVLAQGHHLIATSRNPARTPDLVAEVESQGGRWLQLDVDDPTSGSTLIDSLEKEGTHIDVLVNNAGYSIHAPVETFTEQELRSMMETLYFGPARLIRAVLPHMRQRRSGVIVNMSSGAGLEGSVSMGGYAAGKAAMDGERESFPSSSSSFLPWACVSELTGKQKA
jgi:NAD(P)-dependent dehydrogenase (short-subunit alcohol dehydrogenase family)